VSLETYYRSMTALINYQKRPRRGYKWILVIPKLLNGLVDVLFNHIHLPCLIFRKLVKFNGRKLIHRPDKVGEYTVVANSIFRIYWQMPGPPNRHTYLHIPRVGLNGAQSCFKYRIHPQRTEWTVTWPSSVHKMMRAATRADLDGNLGFVGCQNLFLGHQLYLKREIKGLPALPSAPSPAT
jgi:hypothetical protein